MAIYLIRHAQSTPSDALPTAHWPLSELGHRQAEALVPFLTRLDVELVYSSPYLRAVDTVAPYARARRLKIDTLRELRERDLSPEMTQDWFGSVQRCFENPKLALGEAESNHTLAARMRQAVFAIGQRHREPNVAVASHGQAISALLGSLDGSFGYERWRAMGLPDVFRLQLQSGALTWDGTSLRSKIHLPSS
ncbi:MAG: histidine phosphatase family protein [Myxococcales bacterium]|nr:histidine phosphatase family protein [Myxococcales bacterium]